MSREQSGLAQTERKEKRPLPAEARLYSFDQIKLLMISLKIVSRLIASMAMVAIYETSAQTAANEIVLVEASAVSSASVAKWKEEKFKGIAIVLDESGEIPEAGRLRRTDIDTRSVIGQA